MNWFTVTAIRPANLWCQLLVLADTADTAIARVREEYDFKGDFTFTADQGRPDSTIIQTGGNLIAVARK